VKNIIIKIAACGGGEALLSARIIFLQVGAYAPTCKKIILALIPPSFGGEAAVFFTKYCK
jgi:hypothetical protein